MFYAFLGPLGYGIGNSLSKITGNAVGYIRSAILLAFFSTVFLLLFNLYVGFSDMDPYWILLTIAFGFYGYLPLVFFIRAITTGKSGVVIPIIDLSIIFPIILSFLFMNQRLSLIGILFILVILFGVAMMSLNFSDFKSSNIFDPKSGVLFAITSSILWGIGYFLWSFSTQQIGPFATSLFIELGVLLAALIHLVFVNREKVLMKMDSKIILTGVLIGLCMTIADLGTNIGMSEIGVPLTMAITGARPAVGAIAGYFLFRERLEYKQILAIVIISIGVVGVSIFR